MVPRRRGEASIGEFVAEYPSECIPDAAIHSARQATLDTVALAAAGSRERPVEGLRRSLSRLTGSGQCAVIGTRFTWSAAAAAYANGAASHALGLDDFGVALRGHPGCVIVPAALAIAQELDRDDGEFLDAIVVGYQVAAALGSQLAVEQYARGWHPTATIGIFGAAAAAARLLRLDARAVTTGMAVCAAFASGIRGSFASFMNPGQVGFAAHKGVLAAYLAADGIDASERALHSDYSYPAVFNRDPQMDAARPGGLGKRWDLVDPGPLFMPCPVCASLRAAVEATLLLQRSPGFDPLGIAEIEIWVDPRWAAHAARPGPTSADETLGSLQYAVAVAALTGGTPRHPSGLAALEPAVVELTARVLVRTIEADAAAALPSVPIAARIRVLTRDGDELAADIERASHKNQTPLSDDGLIHKVLGVLDQPDAGLDAVLAASRSWLAARGTLARLVTSLVPPP